MSTAYRFLGWARHGLAAAIPSGGGAGDGHAVLPVTLHVVKDAEPDTAGVNLWLYGPGDVIGIDGRQVIRKEPPPFTNQFEPNYFPAIEFDLPDYPWLFSPDPGSERLRPWICLAVVRREVAELRTDAGRPLPWLSIAAAAVQEELPNLADSWCWAHAQLLGTDTDPAAVGGTPERTLSRLLCSRKLSAGTAYIACVIPTFLAGLQAGLGKDVTAGSENAWPPFDAPGGRFELPVYEHWEFTTGPEGDFETLARRLDPRALGADIGIRAMDITTAGWGLPVPARGQPGSTLGVEGALMAPETQPSEWPAQARGAFQARLLELLQATTDAETVRPALHGRNEAQGVPSPPQRGAPAGWLWELNLDPRYRAAAGLGAQVVAEQQEQLVAAAWDQAGELERANGLLRRAQVARAVAASVQEKRLAALPADAVLRVTQPLHSRVRLAADGSHGAGVRKTLRGSLRTTPFPEAAVSAPFRRAVRPHGPIGRHLPPADAEGTPVAKLTRHLADARVTVPLKPVKGAVDFDRVDARPDAPKLKRAKDEVPTAAGWARVYEGANPVYPGVPEPSRSPPAVGQPPSAAALRADDGGNGASIANGNGGLREEPLRRKHRLTGINERFRLASKALFEFIPQITATAPVTALAGPAGSLAVDQVANALRDREGPLAPEHTVPQRVLALVPSSLPPTPAPGPQPADPLSPLCAVPRFPHPMSEPLRQISQDALLPGAEHIEPDTVGLLLGNPRFIEAYMVGLNHAFSDELLWRDLPTDYGATYFRQFWDSAGSGAGASTDIDPIADWDPARALGQNATRVGGRGMLVLLIRGELFRRYPHTIVYAVRADTLDAAPVERYPEFRGAIDPDITFLGFGLGLDEARGSDGGPGWYFVLQEQPTAPRFGLDALPDEGGDARFGATPTSWAQLHWGMLAATEAEYEALQHAPAGGRLAALGRLPLLAPPEPPAAPPPDPGPSAAWGVDAAEAAAITFQQPVRIAIHAAQMLREAGPDPALRVQTVERGRGEIAALAGVDPGGQPWRMTREEVVDAITRGAESFVVDGPEGDRPRLVVDADRDVPALATTADTARESRLAALPERAP